MPIFLKYPPGAPAMLDVVKVHGVTELSGIATANTSVSVYDGGKLVGTVTAAADGTWTLNTKLTGNDVHSFTEISTNASGSTASAGATIYSASGHKVLQGGSSGTDVLIAGHHDTLTGGVGVDIAFGPVPQPTEFVFNAHFGKDTITNFNVNVDVIALDHTLFANATAAQVLSQAHDSNAGVVIVVDAADTVTLTGVKLADLQASDFGFF
jgi:hypothetical protein